MATFLCTRDRFFLPFAALVAACTGDPSGLAPDDSGAPEATTDARPSDATMTDSGTDALPTPDAAPSDGLAPVDGLAPLDGALGDAADSAANGSDASDAGTDVIVIADASLEAATDARDDGSADATIDSPLETGGGPDATDAPAESAPPCGGSGQACCASAPACNAGLACDNGSCTTCLVPLPYASNCRQMAVAFFPPVDAGIASSPGSPYASGVYLNNTPDLAADGNRCTQWNSGGFPEQYWGASWTCPGNTCAGLTKIGFLTSMLPDGQVTISVVAPGNAFVPPVTLQQETIDMKDNSYYELDLNQSGGPAPGDAGVTGPLELHITQGPSWVAFREIVFLTCN